MTVHEAVTHLENKMKKLFRLLISVVLVLVIAPIQMVQSQQLNNASGALTATSTGCATASSCLVLNLGIKDSTSSIQLGGTFTATVTFEATAGGGVWASINGTPWAGGSAVSTATAAGGWSFDVSGKSSIRARVSAYTSGTVLVTLTSSEASAAAANGGAAEQTVDLVKVNGTTAVTAGVSGLLAVGGGAASAATASGNPVLVAALSGANAQSLQMTTTSNALKSDLTTVAGTATVTAGVSGLLAVGGGAASGATASGNPVLAAAVYNTTLPTVTNGQAVSNQATSSGSLVVTQAPDINGQTALSAAFTSTLGSTVFNIKTSPGNLYGYQAFNAHTAVCFVQIFNVVAASVNLGTTTPTLSIGVPTIDEAIMTSGMPILNSATGFSAASTTTATGSTTCTTATVANFLYK